MRKILTILMLLALAVPMWAGEKTITISRNEGNIGQNSSGVYYIEKDGIQFTLSGGLDNDNYLLYMNNTSSNTVFSYNYVIKKIVFHCVDDNTEDNLDCFFWGPSTLSELDGKGNYTYNGKIGTWVGYETSLHFCTKGKPVRFGSIQVTYEKLEGDIYDLVTNNNQIVEGKSYIIVSQYHDKVMSFKKTDDTTHPSADIVEWPLGQDNKTKVKVDGEAKIFKLTAVKDSTVGSYTRKIAWLYDLNTYIREQSSNLITATSANDYARAIMYISSNEYNYLCWFKSGSSNSSHTIRYDYNNGLFKILDLNDSQQRVWLYKQSESYNVYTTCNPAEGGSIILGDGVLDGTSQEGETVNFTVATNTDYEIKNVTLDSNGVITIIEPDENGNYSFTMPGNDVTIKANLLSPLYLIGTANGGEWHPYGPRFNYNNDTDEYYIDVYFKGTGNYGDQTGDNWGEFRVTWLVNAVGDEDWSKIQNKGKQGHPWATSPDPSTNNQHVYENGGVYRLSDGQEYGLDYSGGRYYYGYNNEQSSYQEDYKFTVDPGIYRIYVGTTESQNKGGLGLNVLKVMKYPISLTFAPAGGADAASAVEVPQHQVVTLVGDLYNKIKAINPDEVDDNFMYKATPSVGDAAQATQSESAGASTTTIATLDVLNEGETVTKLDGVNYLGWIVAENSGYYKVIETPLSWIEEHGEEGKIYTVSDQLQGIYNIGTSLWCKDADGRSIVKSTPAGSQIDFMKIHYFNNNTEHGTFESELGREDWDQSNWVELDFSDFSNGAEIAEAGKNYLFGLRSVKGVLTDKLNYKMKVISGPELVDQAGYEPNVYCTANFLPENLTLNGRAENYPSSETVSNVYFLNPKIQEYALATWAQWDRDNSIFVIPSSNDYNFNGAFKIGGWDYNVQPGNTVMDALDADQNQGKLYEFHFIVRRTNDSYGAKKTLSLRDGTQLSVIEAWPIDLTEESVITGINGVVSDAKVVGVEYVNLAGVRSSKPFAGMNIVVTRYSDGTFSTTKVVK